MNYEQRYKNALERARDLMTNQNPPAFDKHLIEMVFPELKESEDEKIKREIIDYINELANLKNEKIPTKWLDWLEKQGDNKSTENVEIKFCEGDKVVSNQNGKVYTVGTAYYVTGDGEDICLHDTDGNHLWTNRDDLNKNYHLWTIHDAKDGDVLVHNSCPFIFMGIKDGIVQALEENLLEGTNPVNFGEPKVDKDYQPSIKEQRDQLFQKMKEAGYEWDSEKKELKKIEPKTLDADKVIAWLVAHILDYEYLVECFKRDFGL